jgi:phage terminase large subunit-like protein
MLYTEEQRKTFLKRSETKGHLTYDPPDDRSMAEFLADMQESDRKKWLNSFSSDEIELILSDHKYWARQKQLPPPGSWLVWLILAGRGFGKTHTGALWVNDIVTNHNIGRVTLVARTAADARDTMTEGISGILALSYQHNRPKYVPSKRRIEWPNGAIATLFSSEEPDALRGPQGGAAWCDELASWKYVEETWSNLQFGLRSGKRTRMLVTTTPRPIPRLKKIIASRNTVIVQGTTYENLHNLAENFREEVLGDYEGTTLGRQEIGGELVEDNDGALWIRSNIQHINAGHPLYKRITSIVVAVDPATTSKKRSAETGIIVVGLAEEEPTDEFSTTIEHAIVLADYSGKMSPERWARMAVDAYYEWDADEIVAEVNNGGDLVATNIHSIDPEVPVEMVRATRGKAIRAEPVVNLYEQKRVHHIGQFVQLEDQMCSWTPDDNTSPDRVDALVWGIYRIIIERRNKRRTSQRLAGVGPVSLERPSSWHTTPQGLLYPQ